MTADGLVLEVIITWRCCECVRGLVRREEAGLGEEERRS
jgi:hypothetical protein